MTPVYQTIHTDLSRGIIGNCLVACIASLTGLPLEDIPRDHDNCMQYLSECGWGMKHMKGRPPKDGRHYIASYTVPKRIHQGSNIGHCVIWRNGKIVHDPKDRKVRLYRMRHYYNVQPQQRQLKLSA